MIVTIKSGKLSDVMLTISINAIYYEFETTKTFVLCILSFFPMCLSDLLHHLIL